MAEYKDLQLTKFVKAAGCAAKLDPGGLTKILDVLKPHPLVLTGVDNNEDASVFAISEDLALVQTLDFVTPIVNSPYHFGAVAAANALSDVFAMGGEVLNALNIVGFDNVHFDEGVLAEILAGASEKVAECGGVIVGGHTINAPEMFFGLSVTGKVNPRKFLANNTAKSGDVLMLTKPVGSGILSTALKGDMLESEKIMPWLNIVQSLNVYASRILLEFTPHALTDITGFGLLGHLKEMLNPSVCIELYKDKVPFYNGVHEKFALGLVPGGAYKNQKNISPFVKFSSENSAKFKQNNDFTSQNFTAPQGFEFGVKEGEELLLFDPQTSGPLACALPLEKAKFALEKLHKANINASIIGRFRENSGGMSFIEVI